MPPQTPSTPTAAPAPISTAPEVPDVASAGATASKEEDDSRAGSMTLLLPHQTSVTEKQMEAGLPMPPLPPLQRPRRRLPKSARGSCNHTTWVLALLAAAAMMAAVAAAAVAMAARAEIFRLKTDVDRLRARIGSHENLQNNLHGLLGPGMAPMPDDEEDIVWDDPQGVTVNDLSPSYPETEFDFPADIKGNGDRHTRRHIPTVGGSYVSSENGWRPEKPEKRLKLYDTLATGTFPQPAVPAVPAVPPVPVASTKSEASYRSGYHHRSSSGRLVGPSQLVTLPASDKVVVARRQEDV